MVTTAAELSHHFEQDLGAEVPTAAADAVLRYLDAMLAENAHVNLTAIRNRPQAVVLHAIDSLAIVTAEVDPERTLDLGTGNGFPGVAVACLWPESHVTLLDRTEKKVAAIGRALRATGFDPDRTTARAGDAAQLPAHGGRAHFSLVTARAVSTPEKVAKLAASLLRSDGKLALWLSNDTPAPVELPNGFRCTQVSAYPLPEPASRERRLAVYGRA